MTRLSIVIPAYNEASRITPTLELVREVAEPFGPVELIVSDDGSADATVQVAEAAGARVLRVPANRGKGGAVRAGVLAAHGDRIVFLDADGSTRMDALPHALRLLEAGWDVAIGSRALDDSVIVREQPGFRQLGAKVFNVLQRGISGVRGYGDTQCGFKAYRREAAHAIFSRCSVDGFMFDVEALAVAERLGYRIIEFPVVWTNDAASTLRLGSDTARMFRDLARVRLRTLSLPPPVTRGPARSPRRV